MDAALLIARLILFGVFGVAGVAKLLDREGSRAGLEGFGVPKALALPGGFLLPIAEIAVAVLLLPRATAQYAGIGALLLLLAFIGGIAYNLSKGRTPDCHCFGQIHSEPAGTSTLVRNGVLSAIALFLIVGGWGDPGYSLVGWLGDLSGFEIALGIVSLVLIAAVLAEGWLLVHLLGQNGRVLLRLDQFEEALAAGGAPVPAPVEPRGVEIKPPLAGLPVGAAAPGFKLEGLHGETSTLDSLRAARKPVMLVFSDPGCGPCNALLPDVGKWQRESAGQLTIALVTRGGADKNKDKVSEHGLSHVLLQNDREVSNEYKAYGTPTAVVVTPDGKIDTPVAAGADAIRTLYAQATGAAPSPAAVAPSNGVVAPQSQPQPQPAPAPAPPAPVSRVGQPATSFSLPDLAGKTVSLDDFKGKETMLVFWNPGCGFCKNMTEDLKKWEANPPAKAPQIVYVSTGTSEANAAMGLTSPMVLDQGFATGRSFGASGTPSAVLIDAEGKVASDVAVGAPNVLALANGEKPKPAAAGAPAPRPAALKIGAVAPAVKLTDANGNEVELKGATGKKNLLLFWSPTCGFCKRMVDDLKAWEDKKKPAGTPNIYLVSSGSAEDNKALGLKSTILLDGSFATGRVFGASGTPSAVLIDEEGKVASEIVVGAPAVLDLAATSGKPAKPAK